MNPLENKTKTVISHT